MTFYTNIVYPLLARGEAEWVHERTLGALAWAGKTAVFAPLLRAIAGRLPRRPVSLLGLTFPNVLGMAAGFDKDVCVAEGLALLGFGHVEVGTLTPRPQVGNPRPRIFRLGEDGALINRMGFPNGGVTAALPRLQLLGQKRRDFVLGVSLGKQKATPLAEAEGDYVAVMTAVYPYADYLAVNISSPNTPGLRELQGGRYLDHLLGVLQGENGRLAAQHGGKKRPLLVKIAPDLSGNELDDILAACHNNQVDGIIATNTTLSRNGLTNAYREQTGGVSGVPLRQRSTEIIAAIARQTSLPIIGVGGVRTAVDAQQKLDAGASLVQLYTGLVYEGPGLPGEILRGLRY